MKRPSRIIDAHLHFQPKNPHFDSLALSVGHENTADHIAVVYKQLGIERAVVMGNRELTIEPHKYPPVFKYCAGVNQGAIAPVRQQASLDGMEAQLRNPQCAGMKIYAGYCPVPLLDPAYIPYYELARAYRKPVAIHMGVTASPSALLEYSHPLRLDAVAVQYPDVQFVMCHFGNPWLADAAVVLEKNENVCADLSGLVAGRVDLAEYRVRMKGYVDQLRTWIAYVEDYDRFLFGTDWPLVNVEEYIDYVADLIPEEYLDDVFYRNAEKIYFSIQ